MDTTHSHPLFLSPALPSELLQFIIHHCDYPTTLIICSDRTEFLSSLTQDLVHQHQHENQPRHKPPNPATAQQATADLHPIQDRDRPCPTQESSQAESPTSASEPHNQPVHAPSTLQPQPQPQRPPEPQPKTTPHPLLIPSLSQTAAARHIRTVFVPTVTHLRAFLSVFSPAPSNAPPPPRPPAAAPRGSGAGQRPLGLLLAYNFLPLHRHTSEWSVQGLSSTAAGLVEAAWREGVRAVVCEERRMDGEGGGDMLGERVPVLSAGGNIRRERWVGKTVEVRRVLGRWFRFEERDWGIKEDGGWRNLQGGSEI
ncbi:hypothetical protein MFIFM68171_09845 [Madurella fahalii]|uniref:Uncharacterized protein n=1 Tax=Madurella fahalii TaxID=1157608 RepID=A0ABQ0GPH9_9PEZI